MIKDSFKKYTQFEQLLFMAGSLTRQSYDARSLSDFWPILSRTLTVQFGCDRATLYRVKDKVVRSELALGLREPFELKLGQGIAGFVASEGRTYLSNDPRKDARFDPSVDKRTGFRTTNLLAAPFFHEGEAVGVVELLNKKGGFTRADVRAIEWISPHVGFILSRLDLADEKRLLERHAAQNAKLAEVGFLLSGVTHDLGHPLAHIATRAEFMLTGLPRESPSREQLEAIVQSARACQAIVLNLLDFVRRREFRLETVALAEALRETAELVATHASMNRVQLRLNVPANLPPVSGSRDPLRQVFLNLFNNALHAMPKGGVLEVSAERKDRSVRVSVRDSGQGIAPDVLPHIFEKFFTTRGEAGTGLGLSICQDIAHKCGGKLEAGSEGLGKGAVFVLTLPVASGA